jgi:hypothetical protein
MKRCLLLGLALVVLGSGLGLWYFWPWHPAVEGPLTTTQERGPVVPVEEYRYSGPYTHANLAIFLIHGRDTLEGKNYLTLQEALEKQVVVVHETEAVNELAIENKSPEQEVFIQAGDIVKGGKQDRTFPYDFLAPPSSGKLPIASFCVEQGRWSARNSESVTLFGSSDSMASSQEVRLATRTSGRHTLGGGGGQSAVWRGVVATQERLSKKLGESVQSADSTSSLQLSLEHPKLQQAVQPYLDKLTSIMKDKEDVIGCAVVVNGKVQSADVYASRALFQKLWPKLLRGHAVEAFAESDPDAKGENATVAEVKKFLRRAEEGKPTDEAVTQRVFVLALEGDGHSLLDTCDRRQNNLVIHRSVLAR